jgi:hypothetical protein
MCLAINNPVQIRAAAHEDKSLYVRIIIVPIEKEWRKN